MTDPKPKQGSSLREPRPKKKLGLAVPLPLRMPHEELVRPETPPRETPSRAPRAPSAATPSRPGTSIAPTRDFTKVANSITRDAVPAGLFIGKGKQLYDYLYSQTRGAIVPRRSTRISKEKLMKGAGIGSEVTLRSNLNKLRAVGLVEIAEIGGTHGGNEYTVFLPEEMEAGPTPSSPPNMGQFLEPLEPVETTPSSPGPTEGESTTSGGRKTSLQTEGNSDDDGAAAFWSALREAAEGMLEGELPRTEQERERWRECGRVLAEELRRAGKRAESISSVPAFFAEHLRRSFARAARAKTERPDRELTRRAAATLTREQKLQKMIRELRLLHTGDSTYEESHFIEDLQDRCKREGVEWDGELVGRLIGAGGEVRE